MHCSSTEVTSPPAPHPCCCCTLHPRCSQQQQQQQQQCDAVVVVVVPPNKVHINRSSVPMETNNCANTNTLFHGVKRFSSRHPSAPRPALPAGAAREHTQSVLPLSHRPWNPQHGAKAWPHPVYNVDNGASTASREDRAAPRRPAFPRAAPRAALPPGARGQFIWSPHPTAIAAARSTP